MHDVQVGWTPGSLGGSGRHTRRAVASPALIVMAAALSACGTPTPTGPQCNVFDLGGGPTTACFPTPTTVQCETGGWRVVNSGTPGPISNLKVGERVRVWPDSMWCHLPVGTSATWTIADASVAAVTPGEKPEEGLLTGVGAGTTQIRARLSFADGVKQDTAAETVTVISTTAECAPSVGFRIVHDGVPGPINLRVGASVRVWPNSYSCGSVPAGTSVAWTLSNGAAVVTRDSPDVGALTGVSAGTATLFARITFPDGSVKIPNESVTITY